MRGADCARRSGQIARDDPGLQPVQLRPAEAELAGAEAPDDVYLQKVLT